MLAHRMINVSHGAIPLWDWPAMSMDFIVAANIDMSSLQAGVSLQIEIQKNAVDSYEIIAVQAVDDEMKRKEASQ